MDEFPDRASIVAGVLAPAVLLATVAGGAALSPAYEWPADPFSLVGTLGGPVATGFNAGLALSGVATLGFAGHLWRTRGRAVGLCNAVVGVGLVGAGLFPATGPARSPHAVAGAVVLFGIPALLSVAGLGDWRAGRRRAGAATLAGATAAVAVWLPYDLGMTGAQVGYGAVELVAFLAFGAWSLGVALGPGTRSTDAKADAPPVRGTTGILVRVPVRPGETTPVVDAVTTHLSDRAAPDDVEDPSGPATTDAGDHRAGPAALVPGDDVATATLFVARPPGGPDALVWYLEVTDREAWRDPVERIAGESPVLADGVGEYLAPLPEWRSFSDRDGSLAVHATLSDRPATVGPEDERHLVVPAAGDAPGADVLLVSVRARPGLADRLLRAAVHVLVRLDRVAWVRRRIDAATEPVLAAEAMYTESIFLEDGASSSLLWYMECADYGAAVDAYDEHPGLVTGGSDVVLSRFFENPGALREPDPERHHELLAHAVAPDRG